MTENPQASKPNEGQQQKLKRIDSHYVSHELFHLFHLEKGFLFNVKELSIRPAQSIRDFLEKNRDRHMKPIAYLVFCALLYTLIYNAYKPDPVAASEDGYFKGSNVEVIRHWVNTHFGYTYIISSFVIAGWTKLLFRNYRYNLFEIMTLMCFIAGQGMLLIGLLLPFHSFLSQTANNVLLLSVTILYPTIVIGAFFDKSKTISYLKAFLSFMLGNITFMLAVIAIGLAVDFVLKLF